jgi:hypothetical protein
MPVPSTSANFGDLLDPRFQRIFNEQVDRDQLDDMIPTIYGQPDDNGRADMRWSSVGAFGDFTQFTGNVTYDDVAQGYDVIQTHIEFASGFQVERKLFDDDQYNIMDQRPAGLANAAMRTRQKHAARIFNNAFMVDTLFSVNSEGVPLCSTQHLTNADGVDISVGFNNSSTVALSATAVTAARIKFRGFRDDRGNRYDAMADEILIPPDLYDVAFEIVKSAGKPDTPNNNRNVHEGVYTVIEWNYLTDTNNWFFMDSKTRKMHLHWVDRVGLEFAYAEDLDTIIAKWRAYMRYSPSYDDWRWVLGSNV